MKKLGALTAIAAIAAVLAAPATISVASEFTGNEIVLPDHSMRTSKLIGSHVYNEQGQNIGSVEEVLVSAGSAEPMVVLSVGDYVGDGPKMVVIPLSHINLAGQKPMMAGATRQMLASMPIYLFPPNMNTNG